MEEPSESGSGVSDRHPRASPWPLFVALGLTLSEVGVVFASEAVSVGGIVLLSTSVVGVLRESGYAATLWRPALGVGALFAAAGAVVVSATDAVFRGTYVAVAGGLVLFASFGLWLYETGRL